MVLKLINSFSMRFALLLLKQLKAGSPCLIFRAANRLACIAASIKEQAAIWEVHDQRASKVLVGRIDPHQKSIITQQAGFRRRFDQPQAFSLSASQAAETLRQ